MPNIPKLDKNKKIIVPDTNTVINNEKILDQLGDNYVFLVPPLVEEVDHLKGKNGSMEFYHNIKNFSKRLDQITEEYQQDYNKFKVEGHPTKEGGKIYLYNYLPYIKKEDDYKEIILGKDNTFIDYCRSIQKQYPNNEVVFLSNDRLARVAARENANVIAEDVKRDKVQLENLTKGYYFVNSKELLSKVSNYFYSNKNNNNEMSIDKLKDIEFEVFDKDGELKKTNLLNLGSSEYICLLDEETKNITNFLQQITYSKRNLSNKNKKEEVHEKIKKLEHLISNTFKIEYIKNEKEVVTEKIIKKLTYSRPHEYVMGIRPKNFEQVLALDSALDTNDDLTALYGVAGTGKTLILTAASLHHILKKRKNGNDNAFIYLSKPKESNPAYEQGFLPGDIIKKNMPNLGGFKTNMRRLITSMIDISKGKLSKAGFFEGIGSDFIDSYGSKIADFLTDDEDSNATINTLFVIKPILTYSGLNSDDGVIFIDEAQNLTPFQMKQIITRGNDDGKIFLSGDPWQINNNKANLDTNNNGLARLIESVYNGNKADYKTWVSSSAIHLSYAERGRLTRNALEWYRG